MVPYYLRNIVQNGSKSPKNVKGCGKVDIKFSLVITTIISRHSWKISGESFKFLKR